ncbi:ribbon-helix-helix protein, CopG family [Thermococcus sp. SY098]|uniref:ribbon-helix-helix domain-containing protein n=1 Tax=Thermococcus sp. SY098 TaxID=3111325 RepID=UPI002D77DC9E|nr:ribbon-helix-helix protein, CopG family [Thermococcus sp. SY098]WRS52158.1 ribbon-helix-helix protein, CopG family [Thermococcus sp. SY098]
MKTANESRFTIRLPKTLLKSIDELVENGEFNNRSEFVRYAIREALVKLALTKRITEQEARRIWEEYKIKAKEVPEKEIEEVLREVDKEWKKWSQGL